MGFGGISIWQLLIVLAIVVLLFGTKKLRGIGGDLGSALKSFKSAIKDGDDVGQVDAARQQEAPPPKLDDAEPVARSSEQQKEKDKNA